jgi:hypothetical protein
MTPYIIIAVCIAVVLCIAAYSLGYAAGTLASYRAARLGTRQDPRRPICGRTLRQIDTLRRV